MNSNINKHYLLFSSCYIKNLIFYSVVFYRKKVEFLYFFGSEITNRFNTIYFVVYIPTFYVMTVKKGLIS